MLDTNLKSNRKIRTIITIVILSLFAAGVVESYYVVRKNIASTFTVEDDVEECIELNGLFPCDRKSPSL